MYHCTDFFGQQLLLQKRREIETSEGSSEFRKRSISTRRKIFWEVATAPSYPLKEADFTEDRKELSLISPHFKYLSRHKIISYEAKKADQPYSLYRLSPEHSESPPPSYRGNPSQTQSIYQLLVSNPTTWWTRKMITENFMEQDTGKKRSRESLAVQVSNTLSCLQRHGYAERQKFSRYTQSDITLTGQQRIVLVELLSLLDSFQN